MGAPAAIQITGAREFRAALRQMDDRLDDLKDVYREIGEVVAAEARQLVPSRSGRLGASIRAARRASGARVIAGRASVPYAGPIHFGWPSRPNQSRGWRGGPIRPQPFLYDALDRRAGEGVDRFERFVADVVAEVTDGA